MSVNQLASYVSPFVVRRLVIEPTPPRAPVVERFPAAVLFADIAGFTALAEYLAQHGPAGAEALTALLNSYFGQLIDIVTTHEGDVIKFAGDGLLACWPVRATDANLSSVTRQAAQCGLTAQAMLHQYEIAQDMHLSLRVSIGVGDVVVMYIGGVLDRWEFSVAGEPLVQAAHAEQHASPGEVLLTPAAWALLHEQCVGQLLPGGYARLGAVHTPFPVQSASLPPLSPAMEAALEQYIPAAIVARLRAGHGEWLGELRRVTVLFVNLPDLNHLTSLAQAQMVMRTLQTALYHYEGSVNKLSVDDKGVTFVAALGLPPLAHEDDAVRGVQAAQAMQAALRTLGVRSAIGVTTGRVFCGAIGNTTRREYTIMGDVVNLAARLMQAAPDDILCDSATVQAAQRRFTFTSLPARHVKGKAAPVSLYRPHGPVPTTIVSPQTLTGRSLEWRCLTDRLEALRHRREGGLVVIEGEAGMGKSHLANALYHQAQAKGAHILMGVGNALDQTMPYAPWHAVFLRLFHAETCRDDPEILWAQVCAHFSAAPEMEADAPLLAAVLPVQIPDTALTAQLAAHVRIERTHALLVRLLQTATMHTPTLLLLEDAHWFDSVSWTLLAAVCRDVPSLLIVVTTRPFLEAIPEEYPQLHSACSAQRLVLAPFSLEETVALVCQRLGVTALPGSVSAFIYEKAAGHPFFSEELAYALRDAGVIRVDEGTCQVVPSAGDFRTIRFPETLDGVITSRFDRLPSVHQLLLKVASVGGPVVPVSLLQAISPMALEAAHIADILAALEQGGFLLPEHDTHTGVYRFKHTLTHEVVYNLVPLAQRRPLHHAVAVWYERAHTNDLSLFYPLLAHHYTEAGLPEQAIPYWQQAGHHASARSAHLEAISHFTTGIELLKTLPETPKHTQQALPLHIALGTALQMAKGLAAPEVEHTYAQARALCQQVGETSQQVQVLLGVWRYYLARAQLHTARELGDTLLCLAHQTRDPAHAVVAHYALGVTQLNGGVLLAARRHLEQGIVHYTSDQSRPLVFRMGQELGVGCYVYAAVTRWLLGYPAQALARLHEALALAHELAHPYSLGLVWCYAAIISQWRRDVPAVYEQAEAVVALSLEQGFPQWVALGMSLRGWALAMQGDGDEGIAQVRQGIAIYRATGAGLSHKKIF